MAGRAVARTPPRTRPRMRRACGDFMRQVTRDRGGELGPPGTWWRSPPEIGHPRPVPQGSIPALGSVCSSRSRCDVHGRSAHVLRRSGCGRRCRSVLLPRHSPGCWLCPPGHVSSGHAHVPRPGGCLCCPVGWLAARARLSGGERKSKR